jgi:CheY-like chemotaxis protein
MISIVRRNGRYLVDIIEDILDLSRIEADRLDIGREHVALERVIGEVASLMRARAAEKGIPLTMEFDGPVPETIETDPTRLRQILINLVGNAVKFTDSGGVKVVTRFEDDAEGPQIRIAVVDTGIGISAELQEKLFEPFFQGATTRPYGGSGLGLAISRRLASLMGGRLSVSSEEGVGSTFELSLPTGGVSNVVLVDGSDALGDIEEGEPDVLPALRIHVLVVDDHPDVQSLVGNLLERCGARVAGADDGPGALAAFDAARAANDPFDMIILDIQLPGFDGYEVARRAREAGFEGGIIALTAAAMLEDRDRCLAAGCDDYLSKPIRKSDLLRTISAHWPRASGDDAPTQVSSVRRILIVEDDDDARAALKGLLKRRTGDEIRDTATGNEALEVARTWRPQVVLLDLSLPDMDGFALARSLREVPGLQEATLIALTGRSEPGTEEQVLDAGCNAMQLKPVQEISDLIRLFPDPEDPEG